ncbi:glutaminase, partial [Mycobacterium tuberculosis]|nr:glutaminase [Mycobacterium tuberculosis]
AWRVGLPAKSGVGGGIVAIVPQEMAIAVWSPELDDAGNSLAGVAMLEKLTQRLGRSVFCGSIRIACLRAWRARRSADVSVR